MKSQKCVLKWDHSQAELLQWIKPGCAKIAEGFLTVMSNRHHQQRKWAIAFHLLTKALTAKLLQTNSIAVLPSDIMVIWREEKGREEMREEKRLRSWDKASGQSIRRKHHNKTDSWAEPLPALLSMDLGKLKMCCPEQAGPCTSGWAWCEHTPWTSQRSMLPVLLLQGHTSTQQQWWHFLSCQCWVLPYRGGRRLTPEGKQQYITPC